MATKLTRKQKVFVEEYVETGNATQSALKAYDTQNEIVAGSIGYENLKKPQIQEYLISKAEVAASEIFRIVQHGESDDVRLKASKDILDRAGFKAVDKSIVLTAELEPNERIKHLSDMLKSAHEKGLQDDSGKQREDEQGTEGEKTES